ncbi:MAG: hypothetical protein Q4C95_01780 [Planctomycetia bacterium]|nr:hypothetical protein [Planctomycetia bacterium]
MKRFFVLLILFLISISAFLGKTSENENIVNDQQTSFFLFDSIKSENAPSLSFCDHSSTDSCHCNENPFALGEKSNQKESDQSENRLVALSSPINVFPGIQTEENRLLRGNSSTSFGANRILLACCFRFSELKSLFSAVHLFRQPLNVFSIPCPLFLILLTLRN